jgi:KipI family sensor histidine kinase inhibitor
VRRDVTSSQDRIREAGDSALLLDVGIVGSSSGGQVVDAAINARAIAIADGMRTRRMIGVRDVVSTFRSVAVFFNPLVADVGGIVATLHEEADISPAPLAGRAIEVPVSYGGSNGPDLADVAAFAGCTPQAAAGRHAASTYRVCMLGFLPGFPYMAGVDETIAAPRRPAPRLHVPAGSVAIAGRHTGIYPCASPGGWRIVGRTYMRIFDPAATPPALFAPGDDVRFVPVENHREKYHLPVPHDTDVEEETSSSDRCVTVLRPGLLTTIQDCGRWGYQHYGVPVAGPMDLPAHRLANAAVGNAADAATLETTLLGPELRMEQSTWVAVAGGDMTATIDGSAVPMHTPIRCPGGSVLRFGRRRAGARAYVAFEGGIGCRPVLGSRATHVRSGMGGVGGRPLRAGDRLRLGVLTSGASARRTMEVSLPVGGARLRILPGPQADLFPPSAFDALQAARYTISPQSDRMGYRLTGGRALSRAGSEDMLSDATFIGALQVPASGAPILLMADRQTTGGYPQIAVVITADLPLAAQLAPGDWVEFDMCTRSEALTALVGQESRLLAVS